MDARRRDRKRVIFTRFVYFSFVFMLAVALLQWCLVSMMRSARRRFADFLMWCPITFSLAAILFALFVMVAYIRSHYIWKWVVAAVIVELYVISMLVLAITSWLPELLVYAFIVMLFMIVALVIGCNLSYSSDLTRSVAIIFIACFIMAAAAMYALMTHLFWEDIVPYAYAPFELILSLMMLLLVMLHAQTIRGDRFIQMTTDDFLLAALLLFHEFFAIYAMTFYWQVNYAFFTPNDFFWMSTSTPTPITSTTQKQSHMDPHDIDGSNYDIDFDDYDKSSTT